MNPIAFWTFEVCREPAGCFDGLGVSACQDCWKYIEQQKVPYHPLHDDGYPSLGDVSASHAMLTGRDSA